MNPYKPKRPYFLAPVIAHLNHRMQRLSLDISNTFPEDGEDGEKFRLGEISVGIRKATEDAADPGTNQSEVIPIGTILNTKWEYMDKGGLADIDPDRAAAEVRTNLDDDGYELVIAVDGRVLLAESIYMVACNSTCNYLDELPPGQGWDDPEVRERLAREPSKALRGEIQVYAKRRGKVPLGNTQLLIEQWKLTPTGTPNEYGLYKHSALLGREVDGADRWRRHLPHPPDRRAGAATLPLRAQRALP